MANVAHSSLTGSNLHEPKGVATATAGQAYIATGSGSGTWTDISTTAFTGMIADFTTPIVPTGWLELDGSTISPVTYAALYTAMTIQQSGARGTGSAIISNLTSTTHMRPGYYVYGTGITEGTTIVTVDSATQITMSTTAGSSGTATVIVSPWLVGIGGFVLPNTSTAGRYRRSRTGALHIGVAQADLVKNHTHTTTGTTASSSANHSHAYSGTTSGFSADHIHGYSGAGTTSGQSANHTHNYGSATTGFSGPNSSNLISTGGVNNTTTASNDHTHTYTWSGSTGGASADHSHTYGGSTGGMSVDHTHTFSATSANPDSGLGGAETRPLTLIVMTCVKT